MDASQVKAEAVKKALEDRARKQQWDFEQRINKVLRRIEEASRELEEAKEDFQKLQYEAPVDITQELGGG